MRTAHFSRGCQSVWGPSRRCDLDPHVILLSSRRQACEPLSTYFGRETDADVAVGRAMELSEPLYVLFRQLRALEGTLGIVASTSHPKLTIDRSRNWVASEGSNSRECTSVFLGTRSLCFRLSVLFFFYLALTPLFLSLSFTHSHLAHCS